MSRVADEEEVADSALRWLVLRRRTWQELPDAPLPPAVTADSPTSLSVVWDVPAHSPTAVVGYDVEYRVEAATAFSRWPHADAATTTTITGLSPSTKHHVRVRAINDAGSGDWSEPGTGMTTNASPVFREGASTTRAVVENTPADRDVGLPVTATDVEDDTLTYGLEGPDAWRFDIVVDSGQLRSRGGYDYETDADFEVTVTAEDSQGGRSVIAVRVRVVDVAEPPGRPGVPNVAGASPTSVRVSWAVPANTGPPITDYDYRYRGATSDDAWTEVTDTAITAAQTVVTGLVGGTTYAVQVRASNDEGTGPWSVSGSGTPPRTNAAPSFLEGSTTSRSLAENTAAGRDVGLPVTATDPEGNVLTYRFEGGDVERFDLDAITGQLRTRTGVVYDHELSARHSVVVVVDDGVGGRDSITVTIDVTDVLEPPDTPGAPTVNSDGKGRLAVEWTAPGSAGRPPITGYDIRYGSDGSFVVWSHTVAATQVTLTGLAAGTYEVQVLARNDEGASGWSESGRGTAVSNTMPLVDPAKLPDLDATIGGATEVVPLDEAFSDPDGDALTFSVSSTNEDIVVAKLDGDVVTVEVGATGAADVEIVATDPRGASVSGSFKVTAHEPTLLDLGLGYSPTSETLHVELVDAYAANEKRAYRLRIRPRSPRGDWRRYCATVTNPFGIAVTISVEFDIPIGSFVQPDTDYEMDYRYLGDACDDATTVASPWSRLATLSTPSAGQGNFDIELVYVGTEPSARLKSLLEEAVGTWERIITNDAIDVDFGDDPLEADACLAGQPEVSGTIDDLLVFVRIAPDDGVGGGLGSARVCYYRAISLLPAVAVVELDADDLDRSDSLVKQLMRHELAHALGFGISWRSHGLLVNPSWIGGEEVLPTPDTHFTGTNALAAFDAAGGDDYQGAKVPVENDYGGAAARDSHWRQSVVGVELMAPTLGSSGVLSAITIQSMADLGYSVDVDQADSYTLPRSQGNFALASRADASGVPGCTVRPLADARPVREPRPDVIRTSHMDVQIEIAVE